MGKQEIGNAGLHEHPWYWGEADKAQVSRALADQPDGAFLVRNASTPGDYTLTVKYKGTLKLIKILVRGEKCGFSSDGMIYESLISLIDHHRTRSLKEYNEQLDVVLTYPVSARRNSHSGRLHARKTSMLNQSPIFQNAKTPADWEDRLDFERLRIGQTCCDRAARLYDVAVAEMQRADTLHHALSKSIMDYDKKIESLEEVSEAQSSMNSTNNSESSQGLWQLCLENNKKVLIESIRRMRAERDSTATQRARLTLAMDEMRKEVNESRIRLVEKYEVRNQVYADLVKKGNPPSKLNGITEAQTQSIYNEPIQVSLLLSDLALRWDPAQYLIHSSSKEVAASQLLAARARLQEADNLMGVQRAPIDGVFLIRPSASQPQKLVLSVLHGGRVSHCLIEQNEQGWGFENGGLYFINIGDFVRYYTYTSLEEHNKEIKTVLNMPCGALPL